MAAAKPDLTHDCEHADPAGAVTIDGPIAVIRYATSDCCGVYLTGTPEAAVCSGCGQPATFTTGPRTAHWTCRCGVKRRQVLNDVEDDTDG